MRFQKTDVTDNEIVECAERSMQSALACSIRHWSYKTAYDWSSYSSAYFCSLCSRYSIGCEKTRNNIVTSCPVSVHDNKCPRGVWGDWDNKRTRETALDMLNLLLRIAGRKEVTFDELPEVENGD